MSLVDDFNARLFGDGKRPGLRMSAKSSTGTRGNGQTVRAARAIAKEKARETRQPNWRSGGVKRRGATT